MKNLKRFKIPEPERDDFEETNLERCYTSLIGPYSSFAGVTERKGYLRIYGKESLNSRFHVSLVARRQTEHECQVRTCPGHDTFTVQGNCQCFYIRSIDYIAFIF